MDNMLLMNGNTNSKNEIGANRFVKFVVCNINKGLQKLQLSLLAYTAS